MEMETKLNSMDIELTNQNELIENLVQKIHEMEAKLNKKEAVAKIRKFTNQGAVHVIFEMF